MVRSRGLAVIGAFLLIALAIFVRGRLTDDAGGSGSHNPRKGDESTPVVACTPDLQDVCDALAAEGQIDLYQVKNDSGELETRSLDLSGASNAPKEIDGWITWDPAPQIANFDAGQQPVWDAPEAMGSAPLAALVDPQTESALVDSCDAATVWECIATAPSNDLSVGVGPPATAEGLARLHPLAVALSPDLDPDTLDGEDLRAIVDSTSQDDAATMSLAATQPARVDIVVGPEAALGRIASTAQGKARKLHVAVTTPKTTITVVLTPRQGRDLGDLAEACEDDSVAAALEDLGMEPCSDGRDEVDQAGFLYRVRQKAS